MTMRDELIEAAARAMFDLEWKHRAPKAKMITEYEREFWVGRATDALDAILERLAEPDEAMVEAGDDCYSVARSTEGWVIGGCKGSELIWRAMLATLRADDGVLG